jgi:hypothetical protein
MNDIEARAFAIMALPAPILPIHSRDSAFDRQLRRIIASFGLAHLFCNDGPGRHHHTIRPLGYDYCVDAVDPRGMEKWRSDYRALTAVHQMLAASIIWLYRGGKDSVWLRRVPCTWHAADAISEMHWHDALTEWSGLVVLYPGW